MRNVLVLVLSLTAALGGCGAADTAGRPGIGVGQKAPDFTLLSLDGRNVSLADYAGQVVLVNFWATWCGPCELEVPDLEAAYKARHDDGLVILGVNQEESAGVVGAFAVKYGMTYPILLDADGQVAKKYRLLGLPMTLFVDRDGVIQVRHLGYLSAGQLDKYLAKLLP